MTPASVVRPACSSTQTSRFKPEFLRLVDEAVIRIGISAPVGATRALLMPPTTGLGSNLTPAFDGPPPSWPILACYSDPVAPGLPAASSSPQSPRQRRASHPRGPSRMRPDQP